MFFSPRMSLKQLAAFSQRASMCLLAGIDERTICAREASSAYGFAARRHLTTISQMVNQGGSLSEGLAATGDFFPPLFREMVHVGEQSGHLGEVLKQLANHYQNQIALRRNFLASIAWPAIELFLAVLIIGFLILVMGFINDMNHSHLDPLGLGLVGVGGLAKYATFVAIVGVTLAFVIRAMTRGVLWTRPLQRFILRIPKIGPALQTVALARLAWVMSETMNTSMEVRRSLKLSLQSTRNAWYIDRIERIDAEIARGNSIYEAFCAAGGFPRRLPRIGARRRAERQPRGVDGPRVEPLSGPGPRGIECPGHGRRFCCMGGGRGDHHPRDLPPGNVLHRRIERRRVGVVWHGQRPHRQGRENIVQCVQPQPHFGRIGRVGRIFRGLLTSGAGSGIGCRRLGRDLEFRQAIFSSAAFANAASPWLVIQYKCRGRPRRGSPLHFRDN